MNVHYHDICYNVWTLCVYALQSLQPKSREHADLKRRNSTQPWFRRDLDPGGLSGKRMRPRYVDVTVGSSMHFDLSSPVLCFTSLSFPTSKWSLFLSVSFSLSLSLSLSFSLSLSTSCIPSSTPSHTHTHAALSSMIETSTFRHHGPQFSLDSINPAAPDLLAQLFWTAASLLESDYEGEYKMALRLMSRVSSL